jgi:uncharacterized membrane protein (UPF0136 family)
LKPLLVTCLRLELATSWHRRLEPLLMVQRVCYLWR